MEGTKGGRRGSGGVGKGRVTRGSQLGGGWERKELKEERQALTGGEEEQVGR